MVLPQKTVLTLVLMLWQAESGNYVVADMGLAGCRPWPAQLHIRSPLALSGQGHAAMPTAFTSDASGAAFPPNASSAAWLNLVTVRTRRVVPRQSGT